MTMLHFYQYDETGRITQAGGGPEEDFKFLKAQPGQTLTAGIADIYTQYILNGAPKDRPSFGKFDKIAIAVGGEATITGLPNPTTVTVNKIPHTVTDGEFVLSGSSAGTFTVIVSTWPYLDYLETITCA